MNNNNWLNQTGLGHVLLSLQRWASRLCTLGVPGRKGEKGDKGDPGFTFVVTDETLAGDGTPKNPLTVVCRRSMTESEVNRIYENIFENKVERLFDRIFQQRINDYD